MIEFKRYSDIPKDFTGGCKLLDDNSIRYYKNKTLHRDDGPSIIFTNGDQYWSVNGQVHREDGPAVEYTDGGKSWHYKDKCYGINSNFTIDSWKEKVEYLKREEELKVFI